MCDCQEPKAASTAAPASKPLDLTKPVQTRDGRPVRILCTDRKHFEGSVVALVLMDGKEMVRSYNLDGRYLMSSPSDIDLINVPPKVRSEVYRNVYREGVVGANFTTAQAAKREASHGAVGVIKITTFDDGSFTVEKVEV